MRAQSYNGLSKNDMPFSNISVAMVFFFPALGGFLFGYGFPAAEPFCTRITQPHPNQPHFSRQGMTLVPPAMLSPFSSRSTRTVVLGVSLQTQPSGKARRTPHQRGMSPTPQNFATTRIRHDHEWGCWRRIHSVAVYFSYCRVAWCACP